MKHIVPILLGLSSAVALSAPGTTASTLSEKAPREMPREMPSATADSAALSKASTAPTPQWQGSQMSLLMQRDLGPSQQRIKILSSDAETADPSIPFMMTLPDGTIQWRIYFSGHRYITARTLEELLRGGYFPLQFIDAYYADGTAIPWNSPAVGTDGEPLVLQKVGSDGKITETNLAFLGLMEQPAAGKLPTFMSDPTRSRHVMDRTQKDIGNGVYREVWTDRGAMNDDKPVDNQWVDIVDNKLVHAKSSTSRVFRVNNMPWRDAQGQVWLIYDRVTQELNGLPSRNEIFARAFDEVSRRCVGPEIQILRVNPLNSMTPFRSTLRLPTPGGFSVEGANPILLKVGGRDFWMISFSSGNYIQDTYGTNIAFRPAALGPIGPYQPVLAENGDLYNATADLSAKYGFAWGLARTNFFIDQQGRLWGLAHGLAKAALRPGLSLNGWPRPEQAPFYKRQLVLIPFEAQLINGQPIFKAIDKP